MINATIISKEDNVVVAIEPIEKGTEVSFRDVDGELKSFPALDNIVIYHKIAKTNIKAEEPVIKYGEHIGFAIKDINKGEHVHEHNCEGRREDLEKME